MKESDEYDVQYNLRDHTIVIHNSMSSQKANLNPGTFDELHSLDLLCNFLINYYGNYPHQKVLVIGEREMGKSMKALLDLSYLEGKLYFLSMGKGFDKKTIRKSSMRKCKEVFFINDPHSTN